MNKVQLLGRLGSDWELRQTKAGMSVANVSLATTSYNPDGEDYTEWNRLVAWGRVAENLAKYTRKGQRLLITEGTLRTRKWQDVQGNARYTTEEHVFKFEFFEPKRTDSENPAPDAAPVPAQDATNDGSADEDFPF